MSGPCVLGSSKAKPGRIRAKEEEQGRRGDLFTLPEIGTPAACRRASATSRTWDHSNPRASRPGRARGALGRGLGRGQRSKPLHAEPHPGQDCPCTLGHCATRLGSTGTKDTDSRYLMGPLVGTNGIPARPASGPNQRERGRGLPLRNIRLDQASWPFACVPCLVTAWEKQNEKSKRVRFIIRPGA